MWSYVTAHFENFQRNIALRPEEHDDVFGKALRVARCLHTAYYNEEFTLDNLLITGSYAKDTAVRPTFDVDLMFFLPSWVLKKYDAYETGGQSALLQNVRENLLQTFSTTTIKADGQAVVVDYQSRRFEVVPAFVFQGQIYIADTSGGGMWKPTNPIREVRNLSQVDMATAGHVKHLIKYAKVWKRMQEVPLRSVILEYAALYFVQQWPFLQSSLEAEYYGPVFYHDWLVRDFFAFLLKHNRLKMEYNEVIPFGDGWQRKAQNAHHEAVQACMYERADQPLMAQMHWRNIFGAQFPSLPQSPLLKLASSGLLSGVYDNG